MTIWDYRDKINKIDKVWSDCMVLCFLVFLFLLLVIYVLYSKNRKLSLKVLEKDKLLVRQAKLASIGEMLEHIAHQWKQPLAQINSIVLNIESSYEDGSLDRGMLEEELNQIENLTHYMSQTIESFRNYLHPDKEKTVFTIQEVFDETFLLMMPLLKHKKIDCQINIKEDKSIKGYKKELVQTLLVLLNNAKDAILEANPKKPQINIEVKKENDKLVIAISDNGGGIDGSIMDKIFDPYFTTKKQSQGTGHGLSMAKMIVEESFGGEIRVKNIKNGACFEVIL